MLKTFAQQINFVCFKSYGKTYAKNAFDKDTHKMFQKTVLLSVSKL